MSSLDLFLLGPPHVKRDGKLIKIELHKAIGLLAYLAVTSKRHTRDVLATFFWPESDRAHSQAALRQTLLVLKKALGEEWLEIERKSLALKRNSGFRLDIDRFRHLLAECQAHDHPPDDVCPACLGPLAEAAALYRDDFLAGFTLRDSSGFDEWQLLQSESLRHELHGALERLVRGYSKQQEFEQAITYARRWLALDPLDEHAHQYLMLLYTQAGRRVDALQQYEACVKVLEDELDVLPQEETIQLYQDIKENRALHSHGGIVSSPAIPHNLPLQPTPFVGRRDELSEIGRLLEDPACRLLTLVGPGGIGKTRLALQTALQATAGKSAFPNGVYFVPLAPLSSAGFLAPAIADSLKFRFHGSTDPNEQLINYLREKRMLLLLDNFEHLLEGTDLVVKILSNAPGTKLLLTSRERLNLEWEWPLEVEGLKYPCNGDGAALTSYSAARLFLQSARRAYPRFSLIPEEEPFIARICQVLEGMPLAIKLAAVWVETFSCQEIAQAIERNLDMFSTSLQDVPGRHRSLRAAFDHSWTLLSEEERNLFKKLSVFRGGFRREAAGQVAGASVSLLSALMHKSLLSRDQAGRYEMLEVLRQYAEEKLKEDTQGWNETHHLHCGYYAQFLYQQEGHLHGNRQLEALEEIEGEMENAQASWQWAAEHGREKEVDKCLESFAYLYEVRGWLHEGERILRKAAKRLDNWINQEAGKEKNAALGRVLAQQGRFCCLLSQFAEAEELLQESLSISRQLGTQTGIAFSLQNLGFVAFCRGEYAEAEQLCQKGLAIYRGIGNQSGVVECLNRLGDVALHTGDHLAAKQLLQEGLAICEEIGDQRSVANHLLQLGRIAYYTGESAEARRLLLEALAIYRGIGDQRGMATTSISLGLAAEKLGELTEARRLYEETLTIHRKIGSRQGIARSLNNLGFVAFALEEYAEARRLLRESLAVCKEIGSQMGIASCLGGLGETAEYLEEYAKAKEFHQESLAVFTKMGHRGGMAESLNNLGTALYRLGDYQAARDCFNKALGIALDIKEPCVAQGAFAGMAALLAIEGKTEQAVELATHALHHPGIPGEVQYRAERLLSELESHLPPDVFATAQERGKAWDFEYYVHLYGDRIAG